MCHALAGFWATLARKPVVLARNQAKASQPSITTSNTHMLRYMTSMTRMPTNGPGRFLSEVNSMNPMSWVIMYCLTKVIMYCLAKTANETQPIEEQPQQQDCKTSSMRTDHECPRYFNFKENRQHSDPGESIMYCLRTNRTFKGKLHKRIQGCKNHTSIQCLFHIAMACPLSISPGNSSSAS